MPRTIKMLTSDNLPSPGDVLLTDSEGNNVLVISFGDAGLTISGVTDPNWLAILVEHVVYPRGAAQEVGVILELSSDPRLGDLARLHVIVVDAEDETYFATIIMSATSANVELTAELITAAPQTGSWFVELQSEHDGTRADAALDFLGAEPRVHNFTVVSPTSVKLTTVVRS